MQKESIFLSAIRSFFNALLSMIGILVGLFIISAIAFSFSSTPYVTSEANVVVKFLPDAEGNSDLLPENSPVILQISIEGIIGEGSLVGDTIESYLRLSRKGLFKKDRVKAIFLKINSPGGTVIDSDTMYHALVDYKNRFKVPVYAFTNGYAASGGYMLACAADKIYASSIAIVGSVGVRFGPMFNFWDFMQQHGITSMTLTAGKYKLKYPSFGPLPTKGDTSSSYDDLAEIMKTTYSQFVTLVSDARASAGLTRELLIDQYGAQVYVADKAKKYGYVDVSDATYYSALTDLVKAANIEGAYQLIELQEKRSPMQDLIIGKMGMWLEETKCALLGLPKSGKWDSELLYYFTLKDRK